MTITDLITRLEAATKGSVKLDCEIALAVGWTIFRHTVQNNYDSVWDEWLPPGKLPGAGIPGQMPFYTTSLDAALTLVPDGWTVARISQTDRKGWNVELREGYLSSYNRVVIAPYKYNAPTPALAMCAAALKAREAECLSA